MSELLRVRLTINPNIWTSGYGTYESLPKSPGWAIYRGLTVRDGDSLIPFSPGHERPVVYRELNPTLQVVDLLHLAQKKRKHPIASAGLFAGGSLLANLAEGDDVVWLPRPDNPFDENAVEVYIRGVMVGHLARDLAETQSKMLSKLHGSAFRVSKYPKQSPERWDQVKLSRPEPREIARFIQEYDQA